MSDAAFNQLVTALALTGAGLLAIGGLVVAFTASGKAARHPKGRIGILADNLLVIWPMIGVLALMLLRAFTEVEQSVWWIPAWAVVATAAVSSGFVPGVRRARKRLDAVHRYPPP